MPRYSKERKEAVVRKMCAPENKTLLEISKEEGIGLQTLYYWRSQARSKGKLMPDSGTTPVGWSSKDKFAAVLQTAGLSEEEISQYCRSRGLYPEQIKVWKEACEAANDWESEQSRLLKAAGKEDKKKVSKLEQELLRKEKALAEMAALLMLRKKISALWGTDEEE
jgi:transposase-like protein